MLRRRLFVFAFVLVACVGCDHAAKQVAIQLLAEGRGLSLLGGVVQLQLVANPGAFLSLGAGLPEALRHFLLIGLVPLALLVVCWLIWRSPGASRAQAAALGLVAGGGLANWIDRVADDGAVTDYVSLGLGALRTGIFNLADVAIVAGVLLLLRAGAGSSAGATAASAGSERTRSGC
jgi:signal peptidase II